MSLRLVQTCSIMTLVLALGAPLAHEGRSAAAGQGAVLSPSSTNSARAVTPGKSLKGKATLYPNACEGHETAAGTTFHQDGHTAASNKLPLGTTVKVTNLATGKSTHVTVLDHGPGLGAKRIDLSKKAATEIGLTSKQGVAPVAIKVTAAAAGDTKGAD
jgi:rare lipoprotein A